MTGVAAEGPIPAGTPAPDFTLLREDGSEFTRADLVGKTTVLVFYPFAFSPVCTDQIGLYEDVLSDYLAKRGATMYGVSCDARWSQTAFREKLGATIEQLSDFEPTARARDHRPGRRGRLELPGSRRDRPARRQSDLRRPRRRRRGFRAGVARP
jgi:peroxiredoxin